MRRILGIVLILGVVVSGYGIARSITSWRAERRRREVFPAASASALLNPLRGLLWPAHKTLERFFLSQGQTVLEIGPGPGFFTIEASRMVGPSGRLICLDVQREMIDQLTARLEDGATNVHALVGDAMHLPLRASSVHRAFLVAVLGEIPNPQLALADLARVLTADGVLGISETIRDPDYVRVGTLQEMCAAVGLRAIAHKRSLDGYTSCFSKAGG